ncbi:hypothetical protein Tco_0300846 [Tanacetum coccineum]
MLRTCYGHGLTKGTIIQIFNCDLADPTQGILNVGGIFLYKTPNEAFKMIEDKVLLKLDFSKDSHIKPYPKIVVSAGASNINVHHGILLEKFKALSTNIDYELLEIRRELNQMQNNHRENEGHQALQIYMSDDTPMCDPMEANYIQGYHRGYHDRKPKNSYSYPNNNYPQSRPQNRMPQLGLSRNHTANRTKTAKTAPRQKPERKPIVLESFPRTINTTPRHEFIYKPPSIQNENDKGDVEFIEEDEIEPILTTPNPNPIISDSLTELNAIVGIGNGVSTKKEIEKDDMGMPKEPNKD